MSLSWDYTKQDNVVEKQLIAKTDTKTVSHLLLDIHLVSIYSHFFFVKVFYSSKILFGLCGKLRISYDTL